MGVAVARGNTGMALFTTVDGGANWTNQGDITGSDDDCVSPSINKLYIDSEPYIVLGYTDRGPNRTCWSVVSLAEVFGSAPLDALEDYVITGAADMDNASGYQKAVIYPNGDMAYVEFKEYSGDDPTQVRFGKASPKAWANRTFCNNTLTITPSLITSTADTQVNATSNSTTDYPCTIINLADNYGVQFGAYGFSNRTYDASTVDYTIDIGGDLIIKVDDVERFRFLENGRLESSSASYENLVTTDDSITSRKWVLDNMQDLGEYTVAGLPTASSNANAYALATDASGGRTVVRSDGTNWKVVVVEGATVTT
jgi:hypothetical protein